MKSGIYQNPHSFFVTRKVFLLIFSLCLRKSRWAVTKINAWEYILVNLDLFKVIFYVVPWEITTIRDNLFWYFFQPPFANPSKEGGDECYPFFYSRVFDKPLFHDLLGHAKSLVTVRQTWSWNLQRLWAHLVSISTTRIFTGLVHMERTWQFLHGFSVSGPWVFPLSKNLKFLKTYHQLDFAGDVFDIPPFLSFHLSRQKDKVVCLSLEVVRRLFVLAD